MDTSTPSCNFSSAATAMRDLLRRIAGAEVPEREAVAIAIQKMKDADIRASRSAVYYWISDDKQKRRGPETSTLKQLLDLANIDGAARSFYYDAVAAPEKEAGQ